MKKAVVVLIGVLLIFAALKGALVMAFGVSANAGVTEVKQYVNSRESKRIQHNYQVSYTFTDSAGNTKNGSYIQYKVYDVTQLPDTGDRIAIKYLAFYSGMSYPEDQPVMTATDILWGLGGMILISGVIVRRKRKGKEAVSNQQLHDGPGSEHFNHSDK